MAPIDSDLPILRYIFVHHIRKFPFLDQAREKEFWQDKLQVVRYRFFVWVSGGSGVADVWTSFLNRLPTNMFPLPKIVLRKRNAESWRENAKS